jgi:hypothetical protein
LLDGKTVTAAGEQWLVSVDSVCRAGADFWIQLTLTGPVMRQLLVKLASATPVSAVLPRVRAWLEDPHQTGSTLFL